MPISLPQQSSIVTLYPLATGLPVYYKAAANTAAARATALYSAWAAMVAGDKLDVGPGTYQMTTLLQVLDDVTINFQGCQLLANTNTTTKMFQANATNRWNLQGHCIATGNAAGGGVVADEGFLMTQGNIATFGINGVFELNNFKGPAVYLTHSETLQNSGIVCGIQAKECGWGINITAGCEYIKTIGCSFHHGTIGVYMAGGNNSFTGCNITNNATNVYLDTGSNHGHSEYVTCQINHGTSYNLYCNNVTLPVIFIGCDIASGIVYFLGGWGVTITGGLYNGSSGSITVDATTKFTGKHYFRGVQFFGATPAVNVGGNARKDVLVFENCIDANGTYSTDNYGLRPEAGGTGNAQRFTAGLIPVPDADGVYDQDTNFKREPGSGIITHTGIINHINTTVPSSFTSGVHSAAVLKFIGRTDTDPAAIDPATLTPTFLHNIHAEGIANNTLISSIADGSGNGRTLTQATAIYQPRNFTNILNGKSVARYSSGQKGAAGIFVGNVLNTVSVTLAQPFTFFIVAKQSNRDVNASYDLLLATLGGVFAGFSWNRANLTGSLFAGTTVNFTVDVAKWHIYEFVLNGASSTISVDGAARSTVNPGAGGVSGICRLGANGTTPDTMNQLAWDGDIAYQVLIPSAVSLANAEGVRRYLANYYGLPIALGTTASSTVQTGNLQEFYKPDGTTLMSAIGPVGEYKIKEGAADARMGTVVLVGGTATVSTTAVTANSRIFLTAQSLGTVSVGQGLAVSARVAGTSFTITSGSAIDTSTVAWEMLEPA